MQAGVSMQLLGFWLRAKLNQRPKAAPILPKQRVPLQHLQTLRQLQARRGRRHQIEQQKLPFLQVAAHVARVGDAMPLRRCEHGSVRIGGEPREQVGGLGLRPALLGHLNASAAQAAVAGSGTPQLQDIGVGGAPKRLGEGGGVLLAGVPLGKQCRRGQTAQVALGAQAGVPVRIQPRLNSRAGVELEILYLWSRL